MDRRLSDRPNNGILPLHPIEKLWIGPIRFLASLKKFNDAIGPNRKFGLMTQLTIFSISLAFYWNLSAT